MHRERAHPPDPRRCRVGVALGGGSARGYAHIGVLAALERHGLAPDVIVGTSFGAVVGALYCMGRSPAMLRAEAEAVRRRDLLPKILDVGPLRGALLKGNKLESYLERLVEGRSFGDLHRTFAVVATDLATGERVLLREGPLAPALRASASVPLLFAPTLLGGRRLVDGGIGTPVPVASLAGFDVSVSIGVGAGLEATGSPAFRALRRALGSPAGRAIRSRLRRTRGRGSWGLLLQAASLTADAFGAADAYGVADALGAAGAGAVDTRESGAQPKVPAGSLHVQARPPISWLRFDRARLAIQAGERAMEGAWPRLKAALQASEGGPAVAGD